MTATDSEPKAVVPAEWVELDERRTVYRSLPETYQQELILALKKKGNHWVADCVFGVLSYAKLNSNRDTAVLGRALDMVDGVFKRIYIEVSSDE